MPTVLSVTLAVGAQQLAKHKAIVTHITAIEELAGVTILCSDKTGTLTTNKLTIDKDIVKTYGPFSPQDVILLAAYALHTENQDAIDQCVVGTLDDPARARAGIKLLDFKPFNPVDKRIKITYREESSGKLKCVTKGMTGIIIELCTHNKTEEVENQLEADVTDFAGHGLHALAVTYEELDHDNFEGEGNSFKLIGLLAIFDPPRDDTKQTIDDAIALGVKVKMVTGDQLAIAKETSHCLGLSDHMYLAKVLKDSPTPSGKRRTLDEMIMDAHGFAGVFPEHKYKIVKHLQGLSHLCTMTGDSTNDTPALSHANVGIAVTGSTDAARGATDIILTEPSLSTIIHAIKGSHQIFQHMRNYAIYACTVTIRIVFCFAILAFAYQFDLPPCTIMTLSVDHVLPSSTPDAWDLAEIFTFTVAYGLYLTMSTIVLIVIILETNFFEDKFGDALESEVHDNSCKNHNNRQLHMIVYLQVAMISQALIFITHSHGFFTGHPSTTLLSAFAVAQLILLIIAYANWGFTDIHSISDGSVGIVWVWNIAWFFPLDWIKFAMKAIIIHWFHECCKCKAHGGLCYWWRCPSHHTTSHADSIHKLVYSNLVSSTRTTTPAVKSLSP